MTENKTSGTVDPKKNILVGMLIPFAAIAGFAAAAVVIALIAGVTDPKTLEFAAQIGATLAAFGTLLGVAELLAGIFISGGPFLKRFYMAIGYLITWSVAVTLIWYIFYRG